MILDEHGNQIESAVPSVPSKVCRCGSGPDKHETVNGFGGRVKVVCLKCGATLESWRDE